MFNQRRKENHAVAVLVVTPLGIPLIRDPKKPSPIFWKLPGGRSAMGETPENCALRELREEIGMHLSESDLKIICEEDRDDHTFTVFRADISTSPEIKSRGNEGEEVRMFKPRDILNLQDFFPNHRKVVESILLQLN